MSNAFQQVTHDASCTDESGAAWLVLLLSPLAASAIILRVGVYCSLSFHAAACLLLIMSGLMAGSLAMWLWPLLSNPMLLLATDKKRDASRYLVGLVCVITGVAAICLHRPDADDATYLPKIIHYLAYPTSVMNGVVPEVASTPPAAFPLAAAPYSPTSYEFAQAAFAHLTGINFFTVYYVLTPLVAGIVGVLALIYMLRLLGCSSDAAAGAVLVMIPVILLMGETHRSLGNVTLLRLFQSKFAFFWFGLPIFIDLTLIHLREGGRITWICLFIAATALGGITSSALVMLPILALLLAAAWQLLWIGHKWCIRQCLIYGLSLLPIVGFALDFRRFASSQIGYGSEINVGFPQDFSAQFELVYGAGVLPTTMIVLGLALLVCLTNPKKNAFLLGWMVLGFLMVLNPLSAPWIMKHLTTENIYWRLFYLLPQLPLLGVGIAHSLERIRATRLRIWVPSMICFALVGLAFFFPTSTLRKTNGTRIGPPGPTVDSVVDDASKVLKLAPPGVMLAPIELAQNMAIVSAEHSQIATRESLMANVFHDRRQEYVERLAAAQFLAGKGGSMGSLNQMLRSYEPKTVVIADGALTPAVARLLASEGLQLAGRVQPWQVYIRR